MQVHKKMNIRKSLLAMSAGESVIIDEQDARYYAIYTAIRRLNKQFANRSYTATVRDIPCGTKVTRLR